MRGKVLNWLVPGVDELAETTKRALQLVGNRRVKYHLEYPNGGTNPLAPLPCDMDTNGCDCIGFALWCAGMDRYQPHKFPLYDGYINTDSLMDEAQEYGGTAWFKRLLLPEPGCFIVGHSYRKKLALRRTIGHIGVVTDISEYVAKGLAGIHVVHCSPSNVKYNGTAIWKTAGSLWSSYPNWGFFRLNRAYALSR